MKKINLLIPTLLATSLVPVISATACSQTQEQDIEIELLPYGKEIAHRSEQISIEGGKSYKFVINSISSSERLFYFANADGTKAFSVAAALHVVLIDGRVSSEHSFIFDAGDLKIEDWYHTSGKAEIYITALRTKENIYAWTKA